MNRKVVWVFWISLFVWFAASMMLSFTRFSFLVWPIAYMFTIFYSFSVMVVALYKFSNNKYIWTFEGKVFGLICGIMLFTFLSQVSWMLWTLFGTSPSFVLGYASYELFFTIFMNFTRAVVYVLGIILMIRTIRSMEPRITWPKQIIWLFLALISIMAFDILVIHPSIFALITQRNAFLIAKGLIDLVCPILNIFLLLVSIWGFIHLLSLKKAKFTGIIGLIVAALIELVFIAMMNENYYNQSLSQLISLGYILQYMIIAYALIKYKANDELEKLNQKLVSILKYVKFNPNCIKKDISKNFNITRMTTNTRLRKLSSLGLLDIEKHGRTKLIRLSEKGTIFLNAL